MPTSRVCYGESLTHHLPIGRYKEIAKFLKSKGIQTAYFGRWILDMADLVRYAPQ
jgi:hypothetical protein